MSKNAKAGYIFIPPEPLGAMLLSKATDLTGLTDQARQRGSTVYSRNPSTGAKELFTRLEADPVDSTGTIQLPLDTARALYRLAKRFPDCPVPIQLRYYDCEFPGNRPHAWTEIYHLDHGLFGDASFSNLTAQGPDVNDAVPTLSIDVVHAGVEIIDQSPPVFYRRAVNEPPWDVEYAGSPGCGDCEGSPQLGCETLYAVFDDTLTVSTDGGVTFNSVTTGITFSAGGFLTVAGGRLIVTNKTLMYYSDDPTGGAPAWSEATLPAGVTTIGRLAASGEYVYVIFDSNGVLRSADNGSTWDVVTDDGAITAEVMGHISADGSVVFVAGANTTGLISTDNGESGTWTEVALPGAATLDAAGCHAAQWSERSEKAVLLFVSMQAAGDRIVSRSPDYGVTWSVRLTLSGSTGTDITSIESALHGYIVYVHDKNDTYKSVDSGYSFLDISNPEVTFAQPTFMDLCPHDPNQLIVIGAVAV